MKKILVIGAGGVGTRLIPLAHKMFDLTVMDGDTFELKNMNRQIMGRNEVGMNKADAMAKMYGVASIPKYLDEPDDLFEFGDSLVICIPDNHKCRLISILAADMFGFPLILAGNEEYTANAMYYHRRYLGTPVDPRVRYEDIIAGTEREIGETCLQKVDTKPQTGLANSMAADFALALAVYWLGELPDRYIVDRYAPFEFLWHRSSIECIKGCGA